MLTTFQTQVARVLTQVDDSNLHRDVHSFIEGHAVRTVAQLRQLPAALRIAKDAALAIWLLTRVADGRDSITTHTLMMSLRHVEPVVRAEAARSFSVRRTPMVVPILAGLVSDDPNEDARVAAAYALGQMGYADAIAPLRDALQKAQEAPAVRGMAAESLGVVGADDDDSVEALVAGLADAAAEVRFWCASALGAMRVRRAVPALRALQNDRVVVDGIATVADEARQALKQIEATPVRRLQNKGIVRPAPIDVGHFTAPDSISETYILVWRPSVAPTESVLTAFDHALVESSKYVRLGEAFVWLIKTDNRSQLFLRLDRVVRSLDPLFMLEVKSAAVTGRVPIAISAFLEKASQATRPKPPRRS